MDNQLKKWVMLSYVGISALLIWVVIMIGDRMANAYDIEARMKDIDTYIRVGAFVLGGICFAILAKHRKANTYMNEVAIEMSRVTWPTVPDTQKATVVVIVMVLISGVFLGGLDAIMTWILQKIL